jgi:SAM-dependent MidA family methyltransferase
MSSPVTFEQFMAEALHHPERGYYARRITGVGRSGDFTTAPMLSDAPARAIARWAQQAMKETGCHHLIELGPGEGSLAAGVLKNLPWLVRRKTQLHLVETSSPLAERQRKLLGNRATWHRSPKAALAACKGNAIIYSNELVDAFPVRCFEKSTLGWQELAVSLNPPRESLLPPAPLPDSSGFLDRHPLGQRIEVHESYRDFLHAWLPQWQTGKMLTIDYGAAADTLYHRRPRGTLRGYLLQQRLEGLELYQNIGRQDLTADVNFTDLQAWSRPWVSTQRVMSFREFLGKSRRPHESLPAALLDEHGAGTAFQVLEQTRP